MTLVICLLVFGAVLMFLEILLPGLVVGMVGLGCVVAGVVVGYQEFGVKTGNYILLGVLAGLVLGTYGWLRFFPSSRMARKFIAGGSVGELGAEKPQLVGAMGETITQLRPCGMALIDGKRVDVVTEGSLIEKGTPVRVIAVEGIRVVVREVERGV